MHAGVVQMPLQQAPVVVVAELGAETHAVPEATEAHGDVRRTSAGVCRDGPVRGMHEVDE